MTEAKESICLLPAMALILLVTRQTSIGFDNLSFWQELNRNSLSINYFFETIPLVVPFRFKAKVDVSSPGFPGQCLWLIAAVVNRNEMDDSVCFAVLHRLKRLFYLFNENIYWTILTRGSWRQYTQNTGEEE